MESHGERKVSSEIPKVTHVFVSEVAENVLVVAGVADEATFEESDVENGRVEIDELENENFEGQIIVEL